MDRRSTEPWNPPSSHVDVPVVAWHTSLPTSLGNTDRYLVLYDAEELWVEEDAFEDDPNGNEPLNPLETGVPLPEWMRENGAALMDDILDEHAGYLPVFVLHVHGARGDRPEPFPWNVDDAGLKELFQFTITYYDQGMMGLAVAARIDYDVIYLRMASHHWMAGEEPHAPTDWNSMDRSWGGRRMEVVVSKHAFIEAYQSAWAHAFP